MPRSDNTCPGCGFPLFRDLTPDELEQREKNDRELRISQQNELANNETALGLLIIVFGICLRAGSYAIAVSNNSPTDGLSIVFPGIIMAGLALLIRGVFRTFFKR